MDQLSFLEELKFVCIKKMKILFCSKNIEFWFVLLNMARGVVLCNNS